MKKYALVLSGGGFKGAFQLGALQYIRKNWKAITGENTEMHFDIVAGVSVGALNGVMVGMNKFEMLEQLWDEAKKNSDIIYTSEIVQVGGDGKPKIKPGLVATLKNRLFPNWNWATIAWNALFAKQKLANEFETNFKKFRSIANFQPLFGRLRDFSDISALELNKTLFMCGFVNLDDGNYYRVVSNNLPGADNASKSKNLAKAIWASASLPIVWDPVQLEVIVDGKSLTCKNAVDGGVRNVSPLGDVIDQMMAGDDYTFFIINCNSGKVPVKTDCDSIASIALRAMDDIAITEVFNGDLSEFIRINKLVDQAFQLGFRLKNEKGEPLISFKYYLMNPDTEIIGDTLDSTPQRIDARIKHGQEVAQWETTNPSPSLVHLNKIKQG